MLIVSKWKWKWKYFNLRNKCVSIGIGTTTLCSSWPVRKATKFSHTIVSTIETFNRATTLELAPHSYEEAVDKRFQGSTSTPDQQNNNYVSSFFFPLSCEDCIKKCSSSVEQRKPGYKSTHFKTAVSTKTVDSFKQCVWSVLLILLIHVFREVYWRS